MNNAYQSILIISDSQEDRAVMRRLLSEASEPPLHITEATSGVTGLRLYRNANGNPYDCILLNCSLPDFDAPGLLALMGGVEWFDSPVVVISYYLSDFEELAMLRLGAQDVIRWHSVNQESLHRCIASSIERFRLNRALRESEQRLRLALDASQMGAFDWNIVSNQIILSRRHEELWGFREGEFGGGYAQYMSRVHPQDLPEVEAELALSMAKGGCFSREFRVIWPDGSDRWISSLGKFTFNSTGQTLGMHGTVSDITERKQSERELQRINHQLGQQVEERSRKLNSVIDSTKEGFVAFDEAGHINCVNASLCQMLGYSQLELLDRSIADIDVENNFARKVAAFINTTKQKTPNYFRAGLLCKDGEIMDVEASINFSEKSVGSVFSFIRDITDHLALEETLRETMSRLALATKGSHIGIWDWWVKDNRLVWDDTMFELYGIHPDNFTSAHECWVNSLHPDDKELSSSILESAMEENRDDFNVQFRIVWPDGTIRHIRSIAQIFKDTKGSVCRVLGLNMDITDFKRAESALRLKEKEYQTLIENLPLGIRVYGPDKTVLISNPTASYLLGLADWHFLGEDGNPLPVEEYPVNRVLGMNKRIEGQIVGIQRSDHTDTNWLLVNAYAVNDAEGQIVQVVVVFIDTTERKHLMDNLAKAKKQADDASKAKSVFLANMSHEIRTSINAILGLTQLLALNDNPPNQSECLARIADVGYHLLGIIDTILDISKIEADKLTLKRVNFSPSALFGQVYSMVYESAKRKGLPLHFNTGNLPAALNGDTMRLRQVLLNYLCNAIKFTERGDIYLNAYIIEENSTELLVCFEVVDAGVGIAPEHLDGLFEPFVQTHNTMTIPCEGTGLGLTISRQLVHMMGGEVGVVSEPGRGSTFWFTASLGKASRQSMDAELLKVDSIHNINSSELQGNRILLAEDNQISQEVMLKMLRRVGLEVDIAANGRQALAMARQTPYALILMDVQMPEMNGLEATRAIRHLPQYRNTPILAMTARAFIEDRIACLHAGMNEHISKPVNFNILYGKLRRWLLKIKDDTDPPPTAPFAEAPTVLNIDVGIGYWDTPENYKARLDQFATEYARYADDIAAYVYSGDLQKAAAQAHELNGLAGFLGLMELASLAMQLDESLAKGDTRPEALENLLCQLRQALARCLTEISAYVKA